MFEVEFYEDQSGNEPIKDFIVELQTKSFSEEDQEDSSKRNRTGKKEFS